MSLPARSVRVQPKPTVFLVDDDPALCQVLAGILRDAGHPSEAFSSAQAFLGGVDVGAAGCMLLDIRMPEMSGPELQAVMIQRGFTLPIIFLSAAADVRTAVDVVQRGAVDVIEKPCHPRDVIRAVESALARNASQRAQLLELQELQRRLKELTPREREVADLLANGSSNKQTAIALGVSERTVEIHRSRIMAKMQCDSIVSFGVLWRKLRPA